MSTNDEAPPFSFDNLKQTLTEPFAMPLDPPEHLEGARIVAIAFLARELPTASLK